MKELLLIRHAKSEWESSDYKDFSRRQSERGHQDASDMAQKLFNDGVKINRFISSPALRAITTAGYFAKAYQTDFVNIIQEPLLYEGSIRDYYNLLENLSDDIESIALIAHNPGITDFIIEQQVAILDQMPPCGIFGIKLDTDRWKEFRTCQKEFWFFEQPKLF